MSNYQFVVDSHFNPFSMQEMLVPFTAYKDAFEKSEEQYDTLVQGADKFKYLSETLPEGSKARQVYEGYANELRAQAEDFAHNGLTMGNRRALTNLKRRYQGEIGRLLQADEAMKEEKKLRRSINAQDHSMLYAEDNLNIDNFLDGNTPNLYSVSGNELYARGAEAGKAASSRMVNVGEGNITLGGYYRDLVSKYGYSPELLAKFRHDMNAIPELKASLDDYMEASGVNQNLRGYNRDRATQYYLQGMLNGAIYQENHNPQRDLGVLTKAEQVADARAKQQMAITAWSQGLKEDGKGGYEGDPNNINYQAKSIANEAAKAQFNTMYIKDPNTGQYILNPSLANDYQVNPFSGKFQKKPQRDTKDENQESAALIKIKGKDLAKDDGFEVVYGGKRKHYKYYAAFSSHRGKYYTGKIGEDNPGHDGWGFTSSSNVEDAWGNFSASGSDSKNKMKVLTPDEVSLITASGSDLNNLIKAQINHYAIENSIDDPNSIQFQLIEVPNEKDSNKKGYLLAFPD